MWLQAWVQRQGILPPQLVAVRQPVVGNSCLSSVMRCLSFGPMTDFALEVLSQCESNRQPSHLPLRCAHSFNLFEQYALTQTWTLPQGTTVKDNGPRTYRFTIDYNTANTRGEILRRQRLTGEYTRGLTGGEVIWKNVTQADADGATAPFGVAQEARFYGGVPLRERSQQYSRSRISSKGFHPARSSSVIWFGTLA